MEVFAWTTHIWSDPALVHTLQCNPKVVMEQGKPLALALYGHKCAIKYVWNSSFASQIEVWLTLEAAFNLCGGLEGDLRNGWVQTIWRYVEVGGSKMGMGRWKAVPWIGRQAAESNLWLLMSTQFCERWLRTKLMGLLLPYLGKGKSLPCRSTAAPMKLWMQWVCVSLPSPAQFRIALLPSCWLNTTNSTVFAPVILATILSAHFP